MRGRSLTIWLLPLLLDACAADRTAAAASIAKADAAPQATDPGPEPEPEPDQAPLIGWAQPPRPPTKIANQLNRRGLEHHRAGEYTQSLAVFEEAILADPDYVWSRYNRACALARLERFELASTELEQLLREDLPTYGPRLDRDEDLAPLLASEHGRALTATRARLAAAYRAAANTGIVAWSFSPRDTHDPKTATPRAPYSKLRLGIYQPEQRRFVPLSPEIDDALGGMLERESGHLLMVSARIVVGDVFVYQPIDVGVHVYDLDQLGVPINEATHVDGRRKETQDHRAGVAVALEGEFVRLTFDDLGYAPHDLTVLIEAGKSRLVAQSHEESPDFRQTDLEGHVRADQAHLTIDGHGVHMHRPPPPGLTVELTKAHSRISPTSRVVERTDDGRFLLVFDRHAGCNEDGELLRHVVSRVGLETGTTTLLTQGASLGGAVLGPDGSVYAEAAGHVVRFAPNASEPVADVPPWVHFEIPGYLYDCSI